MVIGDGALQLNNKSVVRNGHAFSEPIAASIKRFTLKKILLIATGGTISSVHSNEGLVPHISSKALLDTVPEVAALCEADTVQLFSLDSTNIRPEHWIKIAECISENYSSYDGFVITHGTDTMAYTAAALSYLIQNNMKPIAITGAQKTVDMPGSDVRSNIIDAFTVATDDACVGVNVVFSGSIIAGTRARKNFSKSHAAFGSINFPELGKVQDQRVIKYIDQNVYFNPKFYDTLNPNVGLIKFSPGMRRDVLEFEIDKYDGIVVESFGVGGIPEHSDFYDCFQRAVEKGKLVVMTTQVPNEGSNLAIYRVGNKIKTSLPVLEAYDMTTESAIAKLMWILGQTSDFDEAKKLFYKTISYDILLGE